MQALTVLLLASAPGAIRGQKPSDSAPLAHRLPIQGDINDPIITYGR